MSAITVKLPWPPSVNHYWRSLVIKGQVRVLLSSDGRKYQINCLAAVLKEHGMLEPLRGRLKAEVHVYQPDHRRRDIDNLLKSVLDVLKYTRVIKDDSLIDTLIITRDRLAIRPGGEVHVMVEELPETAMLFVDDDRIE